MRTQTTNVALNSVVSGAKSETSPVTLVAIDEESLSRYGRWPWKRETQARLVDAILAEYVKAAKDSAYEPVKRDLAASRVESLLARIAEALERLAPSPLPAPEP